MAHDASTARGSVTSGEPSRPSTTRRRRRMSKATIQSSRSGHPSGSSSAKRRRPSSSVNIPPGNSRRTALGNATGGTPNIERAMT